MSAESSDNSPISTAGPEVGQPAWRIALFYPAQGSWTEDDYLQLDGGPLVEFDSGCVEVLEMPTKEHQRMVQYLFKWLDQFVRRGKLGEVFIAPLPVRLWSDKYREPDILFTRHGRGEYRGYPDGADLVVEVVSSDRDSRRRDLETKPAEYCRAGIGEYWIVDPLEECVRVLHLKDGRYETLGQYTRGQCPHSEMLPGLRLSVEELFAAATGPESR